MAGAEFLNDLKIRAGWGKTGNQEIGNYNSFTQFGTDPRTSFYDLNGSRNASLQGYELIQFGNPKAKWETTTSTNIGLDATVLGNKLDVSIDWYTRETTDMLFPVADNPVSIPGTGAALLPGDPGPGNNGAGSW